MSERIRVYQAGIHWDERGANLFVHYAHVSPCGEWVERGDTRWRLTPEWYFTEHAARRSKAAEIAAMGAKLLEQAAALTSSREVAA
jgi:hypothetical protein